MRLLTILVGIIKSKAMKIKSILKGFFKGLAKSTPIVGGIVTEIDKSLESDEEHSPKGRFDYARLFGYVLGGSIIVSFLAGWITKDDVKFLFNQIVKLELFN